jgi:hypothetical protein
MNMVTPTFPKKMKTVRPTHSPSRKFPRILRGKLSPVKKKLGFSVFIGRHRSFPAGSRSAGLKLTLQVLDTTVAVIIVGPPDPHMGDSSMSQPSINPVAKTRIAYPQHPSEFAAIPASRQACADGLHDSG